ncbi:MAG: hypothetical protein KGN16_12080 [Burkholderiales bacterium]|nr:hypothetical protein [Burkholderiales bacterium]
MSTSPSVGERAAVSGYTLQYLIAADLIYAEISAGTLEWVGLVDPDAGRVDDVLIATSGWIDAYQVKWAQPKSTYTFAAFTNPTEKKPSLWVQLADGWKALSKGHPERQARVNFVTNEIASPNDKCPDTGGSKLPFQELWSEALLPLSSGSSVIGSVPPKYSAGLARLADLSGLSTTEFHEFLSKCRLQFDRPDPRQILRADKRRSGELDDIERLAAYLQSRVASSRGGVRIDREDILRDLGWQSRLAQRFKHYFHVDESLYKDIQPTVSELRQVVHERRFGYVALLGGPGSGKSTTLTQTFRYASSVRLISYYAFIRNDLSTGRGEASSFWQDIYLAVRQRGIYSPGSMPRSSSEYRLGVSEQLALLEEDWRNRQVVTILLIDGLDHIDREQRPTESLISQLPLPEQIPSGVLVVLGSQTLNLQGLAPSIVAHLSEPGRTLQMGRLTRADVFSIGDAAATAPALSHQQKELLYGLTNGYPLATMYLLSRLKGLAPADIDSLLASDSGFSGNIDTTYASYWNAINDSAVPVLLGLLCRMRVGFDIREAVTWVPHLDAAAFVRQTRHFFQTNDGNRWSFFHNSFRQYLIRRTSEDLLGNYCELKDRAQHLRLAELAQRSERRSAFEREVIYHLYEAGEFRRVLDQATQSIFREQFFDLRSFRQIADDIGLVVRSAKNELSGIGLLRAWLIDKELHEREYCLEISSFRSSIDAFLDTESLLSSIIDHSGLLVPRAQAMTCARRLLDAGLAQASRRVFDLAEPLDLLSGIEKSKPRDGDQDFLEDWVDLAHSMRSPNAIADAIANLKVEAFDQDEEVRATERLKRALYVRLAKQVYVLDQAEFARLMEHPAIRSFASEVRTEVDWYLLGEIAHPHLRSSAISRILQSPDLDQLNESDRLYLAEQMRRCDFERERVLELVKDVNQPALADPSKNLSLEGDRRFHLFADRLRFNRLRSALGLAVTPEAAIPWPDELGLRNGARFERMVVVVANLWGAALSGRLYDFDVIRLTLRDALRVYYTTRENSDPSSGWYFYRAAAKEYFECLVLAVAAHGPAQLESLGREFDAVWDAHESRSTWTADIRRSIAVALFRSGDSEDRLVARLEGIAESETLPDDLQERLESLIETARKWQLAGEPARAKALLAPTIKASFGIHHHKDRQFQTWVSWLDKASAEGATDIIAECNQFASALRAIVDLGRGRGSQEAASHLLSIATRASPAFALQLRESLFQTGTVSYGAACQGFIEGVLGRHDCDPLPVVDFLANVGVGAELPSVEGILPKLVQALVRQSGSATVRSTLEPLVASVLVDEFECQRGTWLRLLHREVQKLEIAWPELASLAQGRPEIERGTPMKVKLRDGSEILERDFRRQIVDLASLKTAIQLSEPQSFYGWDRATEVVVRSATLEQLETLMPLIDLLGSRAHLVAAQIVDRLAELGSGTLAQGLADRYLQSSTPSGWIEYFDGGTRLHIARALVRISPGRRPDLFRLLADDYVSGLRNPRDLVMVLEDLLPIVFDEVPWIEVWHELREHITQLSEFTEHEPAPPSTLTEFGSTQALVDSAVLDYQLPVPEMETRFIRLITLWLEDSRMREPTLESIGRSIDEYLLDSHAIVPIYLARRSLDVASPKLAALLQRLDASPDISVRAYTRAILRRNVSSDDLLRSTMGEAPVVFGMDLQSSASETPIVGLTPEFVQQNTSKPRTPAEFFRVWLPELKWVSSVTDVPVDNLLERAHQIAEVLLGRSRWGTDAEERLRSHLAGIEWKITFRRPWAAVGESALFCLLSELVDFGLLQPELVRATDFWMFFDERLLRSTPSARPKAWISDLPDRSHGTPIKEWVSAAAPHVSQSSFCKALNDGFVVAAEHSRFVRHEWEMPEELRTVVLRAPGSSVLGAIDQLSDVLPGYCRNRADLYPRTSEAFDVQAPVIGDNQFTLRVGPKRWLAINPAFAAARGWTFLGRDDFAWLNESGEVVARTIYWRDGPGRRSPPKLDEVFAEGWIVIIRRDAIGLVGKSVSLQLDEYVSRSASVREETGQERASASAHWSEVVTL